jgi:hypothetical protein
MKRIIYFIEAVIFVVTASVITQAQTTKDIHLMHGGGGNNSSWELAQSGLEQNCINANTTNGTYESGDGIQAYVDEFVPNIQAVGSPDDIAIAHSFGTLAARSLGNTNLFGGYISVAGPHEGAQLATSVLDGTLQSYIAEGCDQAVLRPLNVLPVVVSMGVLPITLEFVISEVSAWVCDGLFWAALQAEGLVGAPFTGQDMQSVHELQPGGRGSQLAPAAIPAIAIRSDLDSPIHWNLFGVRSTMASASATYRDIASFARGIASIARPRWWNPQSYIGGLYLENNLNRVANRLDAGADWIDNSEYGWHDIIGANNGGRWVTTDNWVPYDEVPCFLNGGVNDCPPKYWCVLDECIPWLETRCGLAGSNAVPQVNLQLDLWIPDPAKPSDGIVLTDSQSLPGAIRTIDVDNVGHFQQRKDTRVGGVLDKVDDQFERERAINDVFKIDNCSILN